MFNNISKNKITRKELYIIFIFLIFFLFTRIFLLDSDPPSWNISQYQPIDELYYVTTAFNLYHYGDWNYQIFTDIKTDSSINNILGNIMTCFSLKLFGNNYFGLRMASVFASTIIFILLFLSLKNFASNIPKSSHSPNRVLVAYMALYFLLDFSFLMASRIVEPTIFRTVALLIIIYLYSLPLMEKELESKWLSFIWGFLAVAVVLYVYPTNLFIFFSLLTACFISALKKNLNNAFIQISVFLTGSVLAVISCELFARMFLDTGFFQELLKTYDIFSGRISIVDGQNIIIIIKRFLVNIFHLLSTNIFRLNPFLLFFFLASLPVFFYKLVKERNNRDIFLAAIFLFYFLQSLFYNDYHYRKPIILLPIVIMIIFCAIINKEIFYNYIRENKKMYILYSLFWFSSACVSLGVYLLNCSERIVKYYVLTGNFVYIGLIVFVILFISISRFYFSKNQPSSFITLVAITILLLPNMYLDIKHIYYNPTYSYRDTMIELSQYIDGEIVAGGIAHGFRLYNSSVPVLNAYSYTYSENGAREYQHKLEHLVRRGTRYTILYIDKGIDLFYSNQPVYDNFNLIKSFYLINNIGEKTNENIGLYEVYDNP